jgi:hypothetical protein
MPPVSRRSFLVSTAGVLSALPSLCYGEQIERQPFLSALKRLLEALDGLGQPVRVEDRKQLTAACELSDPDRLVAEVRRILAKYVLLRVSINPEGRVSVSRGSAPPLLVEGGWTVYCLEVLNKGGLTTALHVMSPQALKVFAYSPGSDVTPTGIAPPGASRPAQTILPADVEDRWLDLALFDQPFFTPELSGLSLEYRILQLYSRDHGRREALISVNAGTDTADLGFRNRTPILFTCSPASSIKLNIQDADGKPTTAGLVVTDAMSRVYPSRAKRLAPDFGFQDQIYRAHGDMIRLPSGTYSVKFSRGPEYVQKTQALKVLEGQSKLAATFQLERWVCPRQLGWYSGDHHIHAAGCAHYTTPAEGVSPEELIPQVRGEGLDVGDVLSWGPSWYHQKRFFQGRVNKLSESGTLLRYDVEVAGFPSSHCGHLALLGLEQQDYPGTSAIEEWPSWNLPILQWAKSQGAVTGYAHTGHGLGVDADSLPNYGIPRFDDNGANEYLIDVSHGAVDFLSAVDTAVFPELNLWYHALNCGFRTVIAGETDFPCLFERVGVGRTYVYSADPLQGDKGYRTWLGGLKSGRSYVSDGKSHLMDFTVETRALGTGDIELSAATTVKASVKVAAWLDPAPAGASRAIKKHLSDRFRHWDVELARIGDTREVAVEVIVDGHAVDSKRIPADGKISLIEFETRIDRSSWMALRVLGSSHTNAIFFGVQGQSIPDPRASAEWCLACIEESWKKLKTKISPEELSAAEKACDHARRTFEAIASGQGRPVQNAPQTSIASSRFPLGSPRDVRS